MKKFLTKRFIFVSLVITAIIIYLTSMAYGRYDAGYNAGRESVKPVVVDRIVPVEKIVTQNITQYVDRVVIKEVPLLVIFPVETTFVSYATDKPSLNDILSILKSARDAHQYYIDYPEKQNAMSGNTSFNELWVNNYDASKAFILSLSTVEGEK